MNTLRYTTVAALGIIFTASAMPTAQGEFFGAKRFSTVPASGGAEVFPTDLNGDDHTDLIVIENGAGGFSVHLGDGTGNYEFTNAYSNLTFSQDGQIADVDNDGNIDVIIRETLNNNVFSVFLGNGDGTFAFEGANSLGLSSAGEFIAEDVSGDGLVDLIVTTFTPAGDGRLNILLGNGNSANGDYWDAPTTLVIGSAADNEVVLADVDGDSDQDVIVAAQFPENALIVFDNDASGVFSPSAQGFIPAGGITPGGAIAGDFNNDSHLDIAYGTRNSATGMSFIGVLAGDGNGEFASAVLTEIGQSGVFDLVAEDFNNDGNLDVAGAQFLNDSLLWAEGNGDLSFQNVVSGGSGDSTFAVATLDANSDNITDIAVVNIGSDDFSIHIGTGDERFFTTPRLTVIPRSVTDVTVGDLTGDNQPEVLTANANAGTLSLLSDFENGRFGTREDIASGLSAPSSTAIVDVNDDAINDILVVNRNTDSVAVLLGEGGGVMSAPVPFGVCDNPFRLAAGDVNGDGHVDVVTACFNSADLSVLLGDGNGGFGAATNFPAVSEPQQIVLSDIDANGTLDVVIADSTSGNSAARLMLGNGDGSFSSPIVILAGSTVAAVTVGDFNNDNIRDVVVGDLGVGIRAVAGLGSGAFGSAVPVDGPTNPLGVSLTDINVDGVDDIVAMQAGGGEFSRAATVSISNADNTFQSVVEFAIANGVDAPFFVPGVVRTLTVADVNSDGRDDLLIGIGAQEFSGGLSVDLNRFTPDGQLDTDGDGVTDLNDNCQLISNPDQRDTNGDGFGNVCDPDLNNDGIVNFVDVSLLRDEFFSTDADADLNGDGAVNFLDLSILSNFFLLPPGPGALEQGS